MVALVCLLAAQAGVASNAGLIEASERELRADLAWLADRRVLSLPLTTWPLPILTLQTALARMQSSELSEADRAALERTRRALARIEALLTVRKPLYAETAHLKVETAGLDCGELATGILESARYFFTGHL